MLPKDDSATLGRVVMTTDKRHVWLLHLAARCVLLTIPGAACCFAPSVAFLGWEYTGHIVPQARWWRREAARGIAELEAALDD